ncbi:MAG: hypothetical protein ACREMG_02395, partial [Gemmatimonadales bacterium]
MSRLINPGLGDYLDRLAILELKIQHGESAGKDVGHFCRERNAILPKVATISTGFPIEDYTSLVVVNSRLWRAEDELREGRG